MPLPYFKTIGLILNYFILLCGLFFWDWSPFILFLSFVIQYGAFLVFYLVIVCISEESRDKGSEIASILTGGLFMGLVLGFFVTLIGTAFDSAVSHGFTGYPLRQNIVMLFVPLLLINFLRLIKQPVTAKFISAQRKQLFVLVSGLLMVSLSGMILLELFGDQRLKLILGILVFFRLVFELISGHYLDKNMQPAKKVKSQNDDGAALLNE